MCPLIWTDTLIRNRVSMLLTHGRKLLGGCLRLKNETAHVVWLYRSLYPKLMLILRTCCNPSVRAIL